MSLNNKYQKMRVQREEWAKQRIDSYLILNINIYESNSKNCNERLKAYLSGIAIFFF